MVQRHCQRTAGELWAHPFLKTLSCQEIGFKTLEQVFYSCVIDVVDFCSCIDSVQIFLRFAQIYSPSCSKWWSYCPHPQNSYGRLTKKVLDWDYIIQRLYFTFYLKESFSNYKVNFTCLNEKLTSRRKSKSEVFITINHFIIFCAISIALEINERVISPDHGFCQ